jgi:hypothetical protein
MHRRTHIAGAALAVCVPAFGLVLVFGPAADASTASQSAGAPPANVTAPYEDGVTPSVGVTAPFEDSVTPPAGLTAPFEDG